MSETHTELQAGLKALERAGCLSGREGLICKEPAEARCESLNACSKLHTKLVQLERTTEPCVRFLRDGCLLYGSSCKKRYSSRG